MTAKQQLKELNQTHKELLDAVAKQIEVTNTLIQIGTWFEDFTGYYSLQDIISTTTTTIQFLNYVSKCLNKKINEVKAEVSKEA